MKLSRPVPSAVLVLLGAAFACDRSHPAERTAALADGHPQPAASAPAGAPHGADGEAPSGLDRPLSELTALTCEHQRRTYQCDECRHEVGFVRVPASLVQDGLFTTTRAERRRVAAPVVLTGEVRFDERRVGHVSTQVEGVIEQVNVALGDRVRKGQPLLVIESVAVGEGQAAYLEARGTLDLAQRSVERVAALRQENIASEKELLEARQALDAAEIRARAARDRLVRLGSGDTAGGRLVLRAPLAGTVLQVHAVSGEVAKTDEPLITVGDNTALWVWADLHERDLAAVRAGQAVGPLAATIAVQAYPGEEFPGTVDLLSPALDEASRTVKVRIQTRNDDGRLLAGMFASVQLFLPGADDALSLPSQAVLEDEGRTFVFVHYRGDDYVRRPVVVGRRWASWVEILEGIAPSQAVVADGSFLLKSDVLRAKMGAGCAD